jgi:hypothetical protein
LAHWKHWDSMSRDRILSGVYMRHLSQLQSLAESVARGNGVWHANVKKSPLNMPWGQGNKYHISQKEKVERVRFLPNFTLGFLLKRAIA